MRIEIDGRPKYICPFLTPQQIEERYNVTYLGRSKKGTMRFAKAQGE